MVIMKNYIVKQNRRMIRGNLTFEKTSSYCHMFSASKSTSLSRRSSKIEQLKRCIKIFSSIPDIYHQGEAYVIILDFIRANDTENVPSTSTQETWKVTRCESLTTFSRCLQHTHYYYYSVVVYWTAKKIRSSGTES